jgi:hypothetical protein
MHKGIDGVVLDKFEIEPCRNGDEFSETSSSKGVSIGILSKGAGLLIASYDKTCLTF